jgi:hypothetical protein
MTVAISEKAYILLGDRFPGKPSTNQLAQVMDLTA